MVLPVLLVHLRQVEERLRGVAGGKTLPPVELYKLRGAYFVADGNYRVSGGALEAYAGRGTRWLRSLFEDYPPWW